MHEALQRGPPLTINLRASLTVFTIGFIVEGVGAFLVLTPGAGLLPFHGYLILLGPVFSVLGILFLWIGRHEWNELHHRRVGFARFAFVASLVAIALAAAPVAYLASMGGAAAPGWLGFEFGVAVALIFALTFVTYVLVAAHLVGRVGEVAMGIGLVWALIISALIGLALSPQLGPIVTAVMARTPAIGQVTRPIQQLDAWMGFSYLAFLVAFVDAHHRVAAGRPSPRPQPPAPSPP